MNSSINKRELDKLLANLATLAPKMQKGILNLAVKAGAKDIQQAAILYAPYDSGTLRESIKVVKKKVKDKFNDGQPKDSTVYTIGITKDAWYGNIVEFGAAHMAADPFMVPAFELNGTGALDAMKAYIQRRFDREVKKGLKK